MAAIDARSRLLAASVGTSLLDSVLAVTTSLSLDSDAVIVELGCGGGELLGRLSKTWDGCAVGIDLASAAVARAAKAWPACTWVVANADRRLPLLDASVSLVASVHARRNPAECARVLKADGWLLVAVPGPDDLVELRETIFGKRVDYTRAEAVIAEHDVHFSLERRLEHRERLRLEVDQLSDLLTGTYRAARHATRDQRAALNAMTVTLASDIFLFRTRSTSRPSARLS